MICFNEEKTGIACMVVNHDEHKALSVIFKSGHGYSVVSGLRIKPVIEDKKALTVIGGYDYSLSDNLTYDEAISFI